MHIYFVENLVPTYIHHGGYRWIIMLEKCRHSDLNVFHLKWIIGTDCNWKKSKSWGPFWSYQLNSTANPAHLPWKWAKWAGLAVLFSWPPGFWFSNCYGCQTFILAEIHCYLSALKNWHNNSFLTGVHSFWFFAIYKSLGLGGPGGHLNKEYANICICNRGTAS